MDYIRYKNEIESIIRDNPVEHELYNLIAEMFKSIEGFVYDLRDVSTNRRTKLDINDTNCYFGESGYPDFIILEKDNIKNHKNRIKGAIEIKYIGKSLKTTEQIEGHIKSFKRVIFTNGIEFKFYKNSVEDYDTIKIGEYYSIDKSNKDHILWEKDEKFDRLIKEISIFF